MVKGVKGLRSHLKRIDREMVKQTRPATRAGARIIRDEARTRVRALGVRPAVSRKIVTRDRQREPTTQVGYQIKTSKNDAFYLRFFEVGAQSHEITVRKKKGKRALRAMRGPLKGKFLTPGWRKGRVSVQHPGLRPRPFLRPAFQAKRDEAVREMTRVYRETLLKVARQNGT